MNRSGSKHHHIEEEDKVNTRTIKENLRKRLAITATGIALAAAGALAFAAASLPAAGHAQSADEAAVRKAVDDLGKAMMAADKAKPK